MSEIEREKIENIISAMGEEEQKFAATKINIDILWDELRRRETVERNMLRGIKDLVR